MFGDWVRLILETWRYIYIYIFIYICRSILFDIFFQGCDLLILTKKREAELLYQKQQDDLEIKKRREMKLIETQKFQAVVASLGAATIGDIASAGPTMKVLLLHL